MDFLIQMLGSSAIELIAVFCGFLNVVLIIRRSIWNYLFGFIMVILYAKIFYDYQLYSDSILQVYFFFMQMYGVACWLQGKSDDGKIQVVSLSSKAFSQYLFFGVIAWFAWSYAMHVWTDASYPYWDSAIAVLSILAQFFLSRRYLQNWYLWVAVDLLAIALFAVKGLMPTAALYFVFLILASIGLISWQKKYRQQNNELAKVTSSD